jgi:hypothetical protein
MEAGHRTLAAALGWSPRKAEEVLENLVDASLVHQPSAHRYRLDGLLGLYARRIAAEEARRRPDRVPVLAQVCADRSAGWAGSRKWTPQR